MAFDIKMIKAFYKDYAAKVEAASAHARARAPRVRPWVVR